MGFLSRKGFYYDDKILFVCEESEYLRLKFTVPNVPCFVVVRIGLLDRYDNTSKPGS